MYDPSKSQHKGCCAAETSTMLYINYTSIKACLSCRGVRSGWTRTWKTQCRGTEGLDWGLGSRNGVKIKTASRLVLNKCSRLVWIGPP